MGSAPATDRWRTIIELFRIHSVEPIRLTTRAEREADAIAPCSGAVTAGQSPAGR
jgi:hypothetical protein